MALWGELPPEKNPDPPKGTPQPRSQGTAPLDDGAVTGGRGGGMDERATAATFRQELRRHLGGDSGTGSAGTRGMEEFLAGAGDAPQQAADGSALPH